MIAAPDANFFNPPVLSMPRVNHADSGPWGRLSKAGEGVARELLINIPISLLRSSSEAASETGGVGVTLVDRLLVGHEERFRMGPDGSPVQTASSGSGPTALEMQQAYNRRTASAHS